MPPNHKSIKEICRELRKNQTEAEKLLWNLLRNRKLEGYKFLRQHPLALEYAHNRRFFYVADFYCAEARLVIEADGAVHEQRKEYDAHRDAVISSLQIHVLRFKNEEVIKESEKVLEEILRVIQSRIASSQF